MSGSERASSIEIEKLVASLLAVSYTHLDVYKRQEYAYSPVDNWKNFYRTGINNTTTLAVSGASDKISYRFGVSNMAVKGILPNSSISQQGINCLLYTSRCV